MNSISQSTEVSNFLERVSPGDTKRRLVFWWSMCSWLAVIWSVQDVLPAKDRVHIC